MRYNSNKYCSGKKVPAVDTYFDIHLNAGSDLPEKLTFQTPTLAQLVISANQLNKFDLPPRRNRKAIDRLISQQLIAPKLSLKNLARLPIRLRDEIMQTLWCRGLNAEVSEADEAYTNTWLDRDLKEFLWDAILREDLERLGELNDGKLHGFYYQPPYDAERLAQVLAAYQYPEVTTDYWHTRYTAFPLPWIALLSSGQGFSDRLHAKAVKLVILVEGTTEAILLPEFAKRAGVSFENVRIIPAGGKNQVTALYQSLAEELAMPMLVLLDQDADRAMQELSSQVRPGDQLVQIAEGEFEDWYDPDLIVETVNAAYDPHPSLTVDRYQAICKLEDVELTGAQVPKTRVEELKLLWQVLQLGAFDKVVFAEKIADHLNSESQCSVGLQQFLKQVSNALSDSK